MAHVFSAQTKARFSAMSGMNAVTTAGTVSLTASAGTAVPGGIQDGGSCDRISHLWAAKNSTLTVDLYGYSNGVGNWAKIDQIVFSGTGAECQRVDGLGAFDRVQAIANALGTGCNATGYWGFSE